MATFSKSTFKAFNYSSFRPHYPASFYEILEKYTGGRVAKAIDLGCGTGVATYPLLNVANNVVGLDLSPGMIETANKLKQERLALLGIEDKSVISFHVGTAEDFVKSPTDDIRPGSVDLITAAQCIHWFQNYDEFFRSSSQLLKSGGTLAYWYYLDPVISDVQTNGDKAAILKKASEVYDKFVYNDHRYLGPHWEQPGRSILKDELKDVDRHLTSDFTDVVINKYRAGGDATNILSLAKKGAKLQDFRNYLSTYSSYHNYKVATGDKDNLIQKFLDELEEVLGGDVAFDLTWNTGYTFARKR